MNNIRAFPNHISSEPPDLVDIHEAARLLHVKAGTLRQWNVRRVLPYYRIGSRVFYAKSDIAAYLQKCRMEAKQ